MQVCFRIVVAALMLGVTACTTAPIATSARVQAATAEQVAGCHYLDDIVGASGWYGIYASKGAENARTDALRKAASLGATSIVWGQPRVASDSTSITAKAYRCP